MKLLILTASLFYYSFAFSQVNCTQLINSRIDSLFTLNIGKEKYLKRKETIKFWLKLEIDQNSIVQKVQIKNPNNISCEEQKLICELFLDQKILCLSEFCSEKTGNCWVNIPFNINKQR